MKLDPRFKIPQEAPEGDLPRAPDILRMRIALGLIIGVVAAALFVYSTSRSAFWLLSGGLACAVLAWLSFRAAWRSWRLLRRR